MNKIIDKLGTTYEYHQFTKEVEEYEPIVIKHTKTIFGEHGIYFDIKRLIGKAKVNATKPDGYYLDLSFKQEPRLYLVEIELSTHELYDHIGAQLLRFAGATDIDRNKIKNILLDAINSNPEYQKTINNYLKNSYVNNVHELLEIVTIKNKPTAIVIIDEITEDLIRLTESINMEITTLEVKAYKNKDEFLIEYTPFNNELIESISSKTTIDELDTIVVSAHEENYNETFVKEKCWYEISISPNMLDRIKYFAIYQTASTSAITNVAEVEKIEHYPNSKKYIIYLKPNTIKRIKDIKLGNKKYLAVRGRKYTSYKTLCQANTLDDIWD